MQNIKIPSIKLPFVPRWLARSIDSWISKKNSPQISSYQINRKNIYILPSKSGWLFIATLLAILSGAINYNNSLAYLLCFFLTSLGITCMLLTHNNINGLLIQSRSTTACFPGETIHYQFCAQNNQGKANYSIQSEDDNFSIDNKHEHQFTVQSIAKSRGQQTSPRFKLYTEFPLGLFHAWSQISLNNNVFIYPKPIYQVANIVNNADNENHHQQITGDDEFSGVKDFQKGDNPKHMAWKAIARSAQLYTKEFASNTDQSLTFSLSQFDHLHSIEEKLSAIAALIVDAERNRQRYGLKLDNASAGTIEIKTNSGYAHYHQCLTALAQYPA